MMGAGMPKDVTAQEKVFGQKYSNNLSNRADRLGRFGK